MTASAQGKDFSAYQDPVTTAALTGLDFAFTKATEGTTLTDANFAHNFAAIKAAGLHRGAYHELTTAAAAGQAQHFLAVTGAAGLTAGDMAAVVASDYTGVTGADVVTFCHAVKAAHPLVAVLVYSDLSVLPSLVAAKDAGYPLWVAYTSDTAPHSVAPWDTWKLWQWGTAGGVDADAYNGTAAELTTWLRAVAGAKQVPVVKGLRVDTADLALERAGFTWHQPARSVFHEYVVTGISPAEGSWVEEGTGYWPSGDAKPFVDLAITEIR